MKNRAASILECDVVVHTNASGATIKAGDDLGKEGVVKIGNRWGVAIGDILNNAAGSVLVLGRVLLCKANTDVFAAGDTVGWDPVTKQVTTNLSNGKIGVVRKAAGNPSTLVMVELENAGALANLAGSIVTASTVVTNLNVETDFDRTHTILANSLKAGDVVRIRGHVSVPSTNANDTLNVKLYFAGVNLAASGALDATNGDTAFFDAEVTIRTVGAAGTFVASGTITIGVPGTSTMKAFVVQSTAINTTIDQVIKASATWSAANAGNQCRLDGLTYEIKRAA